jgi:peroxiredoxin
MFKRQAKNSSWGRLIVKKLRKVILVIASVSVLVSEFAIAGCSSNSALTPGEELPTYQLEINLLGEKNEFPVDSQGMLKSEVEVSSAEGRIGLSLDKGTTVLDQDGEPLRIIHAVIDPSPSSPPENAYIVSPAYNLEPQGATFDPPLLLTLGYDPKRLPEGLVEKELYIAYHNGTKWCMVGYKKVDTKPYSVTTHLYDFNFTSFAILGPKELAPSSTPTIGTQVGNLAPNFQLNNLEGKTVSLGDLRGKPVILNFWATWCHPCVFEMPFLQRVYEEQSAEGLVLLAINIGGTSSQVKEFLQAHNLSLTALLDTKQDVAQRYNIQYIPTTFFIDKDGIIQVVKVGAFPSKETIEGDLYKIMT